MRGIGGTSGERERGRESVCGDGGTASNEYLRVTFGKVEPAERQRVRRLLLEYCKLDTMAMIWIIDRLRELAITEN
jgi:hypothetical protein